MKQYTTLIAAAIIALVLGGSIAARMHVRKTRFDRTVKEALETSEGYDQRFIDMVNRLEEVLATRAKFGYTGRKDPMTGKRRIVVQAPTETRREKTSAVAADPFKLTAIIFDDSQKKYTAIVMHGERSYAVDVNDIVEGRRITRITNERVYMEDTNTLYFYDINGKNASKPKYLAKP
jgi:hypothetical protein